MTEAPHNNSTGSTRRTDTKDTHTQVTEFTHDGATGENVAYGNAPRNTGMVVKRPNWEHE